MWKGRSANATSASVGRAERIMRSNRRSWSGWIRPSFIDAPRSFLPTLKAGFFPSARAHPETALLAGRPHRGMECRQRLPMAITGSSSGDAILAFAHLRTSGSTWAGSCRQSFGHWPRIGDECDERDVAAASRAQRHEPSEREKRQQKVVLGLAILTAALVDRLGHRS